VLAAYRVLQSQCREVADSIKGKGTITISMVGAIVEGSFDLTFPTESDGGAPDHVSGRFSAPTCGREEWVAKCEP
jgi:hypothetical protein